jgi:hypothetical protein
VIDKTELLIRNAEEAEFLLNHPALQRTLDEMERAIVDAWSKCPIRDTQGQHELLLMKKTHEKFVGCLKKSIRDGRVAQERLRAEESRISRLRKVVGL